jgi:hypothetical protein
MTLTIDDMYPANYLAGRHLAGGPVICRIQAAPVQEKMRAGAGAKEEAKWVLAVCPLVPATAKPKAVPNVVWRPGHLVILRKALAEMIAAALGEQDASKWVGRHIVLFAVGVKAQGRPQLSISAREVDARWLAAHDKNAPKPAPASDEPEQTADPDVDGTGEGGPSDDVIDPPSEEGDE